MLMKLRLGLFNRFGPPVWSFFDQCFCDISNMDSVFKSRARMFNSPTAKGSAATSHACLVQRILSTDCSDH